MSYHPKDLNTKNISQQKTSHRQRYQVTNSVSSLKGSCNQKHLITIKDLQSEVSYNPKNLVTIKDLEGEVSQPKVSRQKVSRNLKRLKTESVFFL